VEERVCGICSRFAPVSQRLQLLKEAGFSKLIGVIKFNGIPVTL
jgi:hypothetical protein